MAIGKKTGGRQKGSRNKATVVLEEELAAGGELPRDYMLRVMRDANVDERRRDEMAKAAAPYIHARITPQEAGQANATDEEIPLVERLKRYATAEAIENSAGKVVPMKVSDRPAPTGRSRAKA